MASYKSNNYKKLAKNTKLNTISGLVVFAIRIIIVLIMNPIFIQYLGSTSFGIWKSIERLLGFASIADGKATQALKWTIANQEASDDFDRKQRAIGSAIIIWFLFLPILITIISILIFFSSELIKGVVESDYIIVKSIILILGINLIITPLMSIPDSVLGGTNNGYISNSNRIIWMILGAIITYVVLVFGYGLKEMAYTLLVITIFSGINALYLAKKKIKWLNIKKTTKKEIHSFFKFSAWVLAWSLIAKFLLGSEVVLLSSLIGAQTVSQFIFTSYLAFTTITLSAIVVSSTTPGLGMLIGNKDFIKSQAIINKIRNFSFSFSIFSAASILLLNKSFVYLWGGEELYLGWENNFLIVLIMIQLIAIRNEGFLIDLSLDLKNKVLLGALSVLISVILSIVLYNLYSSVFSVLVGIFLGRFILLFTFPIITNRVIQYKASTLSLTKNFFYTLVILFLSLYIGTNQTFSSWSELFIFAIIEIVVCAIYVYLFLLSSDNRDKVKQIILKYRRKENA